VLKDKQESFLLIFFTLDYLLTGYNDCDKLIMLFMK
jgi:hypothetical protein